MFTAWNKAVRRIWQLPNVTHTQFLPHISNTMNVKDQLLCRFVNMFNNMYHSQNEAVCYVAKRATISTTGSLDRNYVLANQILGRQCQRLPIGMCKRILAERYTLEETAKHTSNIIKELCAIRCGLEDLPLLSGEELQDLLYELCTN